MRTESASRSARQRFLTMLFWCTAAAFPFWIVGQIARDATWLSGLCFYIPSPVLAIMLLAWMAFLALRRQWRPALISASLSIAPLFVTQFAENRGKVRVVPVDSARASPSVRLVHWNLWGRLSPHCAQPVLRAFLADAYVFSEIPDADTVDEFRTSLSTERGTEFTMQTFSNLAVVARGRLERVDWLIERDGVRVARVEWELSQQTLSLLVVDLPANPLRHRDPILREVVALIEAHQPDLVVGDFNAPRRSRALNNLPPGYRHAYDSAGGGWSFTWPVPLPVYSLDQCLHSSRIVPMRYQFQTSICSDHRAQVFDFAVGSPAN